MKCTKCLAVVAAAILPLLSVYAQTPPAGAANISPSASEVVRLAGSGVGDDVLMAYVQNSQTPFDLTADNVLYLRDVGVSQAVITAMLNHDNAMRAQAPPTAPPPYAPTEAPPSPAPAPAPVPEAPPPQAQPAPAPASYVGNAPPDVSYFYNDLAPYGAWVSLPSVGWCWQPSVVVANRAWRPYCDSGHWVYTDAGWFWQSDYTWGWAPFHYGRWYLDASCGWVWVPGTVWGPAWVTWRSVGTTCGWAPLPPGADFAVGFGWRWHGVAVGASFDFGLGVGAFAFVSFGDLCAHNVAHLCLPPARAAVIFRQTVVVNNYTVVKNTVVNNGIAVSRIAAVSHTPIPRAVLREGPAGVGRPPVSGGAVVYRSPLKASPQPVRMVAQKVDPAHPYIQHSTLARPTYGQTTTFNKTGSASTFQHTTTQNFNSVQKPAFGNSTPTTAWQHTTTTGAGASSATATGATKTQSGSHETYQWQSYQKPGAGGQPLSPSPTSPGQALNQQSHTTTGLNPTAPTPYTSQTPGKTQSAYTTEAYKGTGQSYSGAGQNQAAANQALRQTQTSHFYSPKTIEQSSQVRSIYQPPKASTGGAAPNANAYGTKKNQ
ncbi:MAG TPA: DUF6600 domain-containing protein [Candidatus Acidoferrum sp.]|nr:DUF6600 domain-containing protein [Candidatus Acidoferrum sp.]